MRKWSLSSVKPVAQATHIDFIATYVCTALSQTSVCLTDKLAAEGHAVRSLFDSEYHILSPIHSCSIALEVSCSSHSHVSP